MRKLSWICSDKSVQMKMTVAHNLKSKMSFIGLSIICHPVKRKNGMLHKFVENRWCYIKGSSNIGNLKNAFNIMSIIVEKRCHEKNFRGIYSDLSSKHNFEHLLLNSWIFLSCYDVHALLLYRLRVISNRGYRIH